MEKRIITISREFGAGGHSVGSIVAQKLGIKLYDKELVEKIAKESGFAPDFIEENGEHAPSGSIFSYAFAPQGVPGVMNGMSTSDYLWNMQCSVILQLAEKESCVIIGRNADYILKDHADVLNVFLHADVAFRSEWVVKTYPDSDKTPEARIAENDKKRRVNYQHYTGRTWGQSQNYDLCLNTGTLGYEQCADIIVNTVLNSKK